MHQSICMCCGAGLTTTIYSTQVVCEGCAVQLPLQGTAPEDIRKACRVNGAWMPYYDFLPDVMKALDAIRTRRGSTKRDSNERLETPCRLSSCAAMNDVGVKVCWKCGGTP